MNDHAHIYLNDIEHGGDARIATIGGLAVALFLAAALGACGGDRTAGPGSAADTFSMLARVFPTRDAFTLEDTCDSDEDVIVHDFRVHRGSDGASGHVAIGWCRNKEPWKYPAFVNGNCPKTIDLGPLFDVPSGTPFAVLEYDATPRPPGCTKDTRVEIREAPLLAAWGPDTDGDCVPDVIDNCPLVPNPDQADAPPGANGFQARRTPPSRHPTAWGLSATTARRSRTATSRTGTVMERAMRAIRIDTKARSARLIASAAQNRELYMPSA